MTDEPPMTGESLRSIDPCGYAWCNTRGTVGHLDWRREKVRLCAVHMDPKMHPKDLHKGLVWDEPPAHLVHQRGCQKPPEHEGRCL